jgi:hypothetical protein
MNKFSFKIIIAVIAFGTLLISCNTQSKKGQWSKADKVRFYKEMENAKELDNLGADKTKWIDCYFEKAQSEFSSFDDADKNLDGCQKLAEVCAGEVLDQGSTIGKWSERDRKMYYEEMNNTDFNELGERKKDYIDCYLNKLENNFKSMRIANMDSVLCETLAKECALELFPDISLSE